MPETSQVAADYRLLFDSIDQGFCIIEVLFDQNSKPVDYRLLDRKRMEDQLRQSEERNRDLIRYAPKGIYEIDARTGRFRSTNEAMCQTVGYTRIGYSI